MCLVCGVSVNWALSNVYRQAANLGHYMKWGQEFEKECANPFPAKYRAALCAVGDLDMIGVKCVNNLKVFFPPSADIGSDDGGIQDPFPRV
jgi:hypothetical protein